MVIPNTIFAQKFVNLERWEGLFKKSIVIDRIRVIKVEFYV